MKDVQRILGQLGERLDALATGDAVVGKPIVVGDRQVIPLVELGIGVGGGGGQGEGTNDGATKAGASKGSGKGIGLGAGGGAKACPVALIIIEAGKVRIETLGQ